MIEPTDEMIDAFYDQLCGGFVTPEEARAVLTAALAIAERRWQEAYGNAFQAGWWRGQHRLCPRCGVELERQVAAERDWFPVIEPTDEMRRAYEQAAAEEWGWIAARSSGQGLAAVLAIVARDHCMERRGHVYHPLRAVPVEPPRLGGQIATLAQRPEPPHCPVIGESCPGDANGVLCRAPCVRETWT